MIPPPTITIDLLSVDAAMADAVRGGVVEAFLASIEIVVSAREAVRLRVGRESLETRSNSRWVSMQLYRD